MCALVTHGTFCLFIFFHLLSNPRMPKEKTVQFKKTHLFFTLVSLFIFNHFFCLLHVKCKLYFSLRQQSFWHFSTFFFLFPFHFLNGNSIIGEECFLSLNLCFCFTFSVRDKVAERYSVCGPIWGSRCTGQHLCACM